MSEELKKRLDALKDELEQASEEQRAEVLDHIEEAVLGLEARGVSAPPWARRRMNDRIDEDVEDQFDNMPV